MKRLFFIIQKCTEVFISVTNRLSLGLRKQARNENNKNIYIYNCENAPRFDKKKRVNYGKGISPIEDSR